MRRFHATLAVALRVLSAITGLLCL